jgi:RsiW-degrading membrane proteinase PrsW (M82 family)
VRFIFNGQELKHEAATLRSCGVQSESVIHCLLAAARQEPTAATNNADAEIQAVNVGALMLPMFAVILGLLWYCRFAYRGYFNAMSTLILVGMTLLFSMGVLSAIHRRQPGHEHAA